MDEPFLAVLGRPKPACDDEIIGGGHHMPAPRHPLARTVDDRMLTVYLLRLHFMYLLRLHLFLTFEFSSR